MHYNIILDEIDHKILVELQRNARLTYKNLSERINLSAPSVKDRIEKMESAGLILGYTAVLDPKLLGYHLSVYISIKIRFGMYEKFEKFIVTVAEITECHKLTGEECMLMRGFVRDTSHLEALNVRLSKFGELTTSLVLSTLNVDSIFLNGKAQ